MDQFVEHTNSYNGLSKEQQRLESNHEVMLYHMGKALYAPIDLSKPGLKILDSGCANGRWLRDLKASAPAKHEYYGTDINQALYPSQPPEGMYFQNQSIKDAFPTEWQGSFDLIHQRFVMAGIAPGSPDTVVQKFADLLKLGGWLQLIEIDVDPIPNNPPMMAQFLRMISETIQAVGLRSLSKGLKGAMEKAGLEEVQEKEFYAAHGETIQDKTLKQKSMDALCISVPSIIQVLKTLPNTFTEEELDGFESRFRKELEDIGGYARHLIVWGRKPSK